MTGMHGKGEAAIGLNTPIEDLPLSVRAKNALYWAGYETVGNLVDKTEAELLRIRKFGRKCLLEVKECLQSLGLALRDDGKQHQALVCETDALVFRLRQLNAESLQAVMSRVGREAACSRAEAERLMHLGRAWREQERMDLAELNELAALAEKVGGGLLALMG